MDPAPPILDYRRRRVRRPIGSALGALSVGFAVAAGGSVALAAACWHSGTGVEIAFVTFGVLATIGGALCGLVALVQIEQNRTFPLVGIAFHLVLWTCVGWLLRHGLFGW